MGSRGFQLLMLSFLVKYAASCTGENIWKLSTCGHKVVGHLENTFNTATSKYDLCSGNSQAGVQGQVFSDCLSRYGYHTSCSDPQREGFVLDRIKIALDNVPCAIARDTSTKPTCVTNTLDCIYQHVAELVKLAPNGLPCFCRDREGLLAAYNTCVSAADTDVNLATCEYAGSQPPNWKSRLLGAVNGIRGAYADSNCGSVNTDECGCFTKVTNCIKGTAASQGNLGMFLELDWTLDETDAVALPGTSFVATNMRTFWQKFGTCRNLAFPNNYNLAATCINTNVVTDSNCNVVFPQTIINAEAESTTKMYQTWVAALTQVQHFCHDPCANTSIWITNLMNCLTLFKPTTQSTAAQTSTSILARGNDALLALCNTDRTTYASDLTCASQAIQNCFYLSYHLKWAAQTSRAMTLTSSNSLNALYKVLNACGTNVVSFADSAIQAGETYTQTYNSNSTNTNNTNFNLFNGLASNIQMNIMLLAVCVALTSALRQ